MTFDEHIGIEYLERDDATVGEDEDYQEIHGIRHPFSDAEVAMEVCAAL